MSSHSSTLLFLHQAFYAAKAASPCKCSVTPTYKCLDKGYCNCLTLVHFQESGQPHLEAALAAIALLTEQENALPRPFWLSVWMEHLQPLLQDLAGGSWQMGLLRYQAAALKVCVQYFPS